MELTALGIAVLAASTASTAIPNVVLDLFSNLDWRRLRCFNTIASTAGDYWTEYLACTLIVL